MSSKIKRKDLLLYITKGYVQFEARHKIGRNLTKPELLIAQKMLEWGLMVDINVVYDAIFDEIVEGEKETNFKITQ